MGFKILGYLCSTVIVISIASFNLSIEKSIINRGILGMFLGGEIGGVSTIIFCLTEKFLICSYIW